MAGSGFRTLTVSVTSLLEDFRAVTGREAILRPAVQECQVLIEGPLFEAMNKYAIIAEPLDTWFLDTPTSGGRFGWHVVGPEGPGIIDSGAFMIRSIVDSKNGGA